MPDELVFTVPLLHKNDLRYWGKRKFHKRRPEWLSNVQLFAIGIMYLRRQKQKEREREKIPVGIFHDMLGKGGENNC